MKKLPSKVAHIRPIFSINPPSCTYGQKFNFHIQNLAEAPSVISTLCQYTEVNFASFLSGAFITDMVVHPPERKLAKRTSLQYAKFTLSFWAAISTFVWEPFVKSMVNRDVMIVANVVSWTCQGCAGVETRYRYMSTVMVRMMWTLFSFLDNIPSHWAVMVSSLKQRTVKS